MYYDFEAAVAYPCTAGQHNPPLRESVYDSDDETRDFFLSLEENPSLHPTLHRRSLSPERNTLRSIGRPVYRHRPNTTFEEYLAEFRSKALQDDQVAPSTALTSEHSSPLATDLKTQECALKSDRTPSPPHLQTAGTSVLHAPKQNANDKVMPQRRPRRPQTSSGSGRTECISSQKKLIQQGHRNPARRRQRVSPPVPPSKATSTHRVVNSAKADATTDRNSNESDGLGHRRADDLSSNENRMSYWKLSSLSRSDAADSPVAHEHHLAESDSFTVDLDIVKIMEEHNERLRKSKSERAGSTISARDQSDGTVRGGESFETDIFTDDSANEAIKPTQFGNQSAGHNRVGQLGLCNSELNREYRNSVGISKPIESNGASLSDLLEKENEKVLKERKKKLLERRRALQQNRRNALRNMGQVSVTENRRINPISARVEFTTVEAKTPLTEVESSKSAETNTSTVRGLRAASNHGENRERGLKGYLCRGGKPTTTSTLASRQNRANPTTSNKSHGPRVLTERTVRQPRQLSAQSGKHPTATMSPASNKDEQDDLALLLSEHNSKIRKSRRLAATIND